VVTGIQAGDRVVVEGKQNLRPGGKIREAKKEAAKPTPKPADAPTGPAAAASPATQSTPSSTEKK
jgi:hypothetical protein